MIPRAWALARLAAREADRDWSALPASFEHDAVRSVFEILKPHFCKRREIGLRIRCSRARTFSELREALT